MSPARRRAIRGRSFGESLGASFGAIECPLEILGDAGVRMPAGAIRRMYTVE